MEIIATLHEKDIYLDIEITKEEDYGLSRDSVRVVLLDSDNKVALGYYAPRDGFLGGYTIPGGGVEKGESVHEALVRECKEETGCCIKDVKELGVVEEYGVGRKTKHMQRNYCFFAYVDGVKSEPSFTEEEIRDELQLRWLSLNDAIQSLQIQKDGFSKRKTLFLLDKVKELVGKMEV